ncbi:MAG: ribosome biogenesis GTPase Der [Nitrospira sp.]|nr:ribosome biogenesis GTPase Der [Nitrospira sp.]OYT21796.1 MAG: ribosome biogenesis GTPase Der [Nitrospira sp. UW-LDO-01]
MIMPRAKSSQKQEPTLPLLPTEGGPPPLIAIIGRPNVGKSTLFNKILGQKIAIVDDVPGVTRDRNYADATYRTRKFRLVDTGGLDLSSSDSMLTLIRRQSELAIAEADILIFLLDGRSGLTPPDHEVVKLLRGVTKPLFYAVNKIDTPKSEPLLADFYKLGTDELYPISAEHGLGVAELLDALYPLLPSAEESDELQQLPRVAIVGRPNVGKSTLVNALLGEERVVVSNVPGTTRDPVDSLVTHQDQSYVFTDTAGIRRRGKIDRGIEGYSVLRSLRAIGRSDIAVLLLDGVEGVTEQDTKIAGAILKQGRACILLINKWDLRAGDQNARQAYELEFHRRFPFLAWAPVLYGSALKPESIRRLFPLLKDVHGMFTKRVSTGALNIWLQKILETHPLPARKHKPTAGTKSAFMTQVATKPPVFVLFVGHPEDITPAYLKYLENQLRETYLFTGTPLRIMVRKK